MKKRSAEEVSAELAKDDAILAEVLMWHMRHSGVAEPDKPHEVDGIPFYCVGHNASHEFYAGTKDGKRYRYSVGESCEVEEFDLPKIDRSPVTEVPDWGGYYGHF
jgi:hypothetical protein